MVVALGIGQLLIHIVDMVTDGVRLPEIERRSLHSGELARGEQLLVDGGHVTRVNLKLLVKNSAVTLALQVKERMV